MFESLEMRRLLSASLQTTFADGSTVSQKGGTLNLICSGKNQPTGASFAVIESDTAGSFIVVNLGTNQQTAFNGITAVNLNGGGEVDNLFYNGKTVGANITGGGADDSIRVLDRGLVSSSIDGGAGNDQIAIVFSHHANIVAGAGDDVISINTAAAQDPASYDFNNSNICISAGAGDDVIIIYAGTISGSGDKGSDTILDYSGGTASYASMTNVESTVVEA